MSNVTLMVPKATTQSPKSEIDWIFKQLEIEKKSKRTNIKQSRNWYIKFLEETKFGCSELETDPRFFLSAYWQPDALIQFTTWLNRQNKVVSNTRYSIYKNVRAAMDHAYQLGVIDHIVYHAPMFKGRRETNMRAPYSENEQEIITTAIGKWVNLAERISAPYKKTGNGIPYLQQNWSPLVIDNETLTIKKASKKFGIGEYTIIRRRRDGWTDKQCLNLETSPKSDYQSGISREITIDGVAWSSISQAAKHYNIPTKTVSSRLQSGFTPEQAVGLEPLYSTKRSFEGMLYDFEEKFSCDPLALFLDTKAAASGKTRRTTKELMQFFARVGVWPFIDKRIIMPLAAELCRLTGMNAESIASLKIDSYQISHPLTNQPYIRYTKTRSGTVNRSEDKELHIGLLEDEELFIEDSVQQRVSQIINLTLKITQQLRPFANGETAERLFIFEHDMWFQNINYEKRISHIIWGVPTEVGQDSPHILSASRWNNDFCKENGLYDLLGKDFTLNFSRFRPTLINNMVKQGADIFDIQAAAGHQHIMTTTNYLSEQALDPKFNEVMESTLNKISQQNFDDSSDQKIATKSNNDYNTGYTETLCGIGCKDAYNPSQKIRKLTSHLEGSLCKYWNMCLLCEQSSITEKSLPKIIAYKWKLQESLSDGKSNMMGRSELYSEIITVIDDIITIGHHFPETIIKEAEYLASELDDEALNHLVYQGF